MEKVGIVFATYNSAEYVESCLRSCLDQDYPEKVVVVSDDGSTDNTVEVLRECGKGRLELHIIELPHGERGIARAKAIEKAIEEGIDYLFIIDSDMVLKEGLVREAVGYLVEHKDIGGLVIPEIAYSEYKNFYSRVKVFERNVINDAGEELGKNSIEAARFWRLSEYLSTGGINVGQIAFEETQPTIRYVGSGGKIKRATFTGVYHNEKRVTLSNLVKKKRYYFSVMDKTLSTEEGGTGKALSRWYFFRPVLYRKANLKKYLRHPLLTLGMVWMYIVLTFVGAWELLKTKFKKRKDK